MGCTETEPRGIIVVVPYIDAYREFMPASPSESSKRPQLVQDPRICQGDQEETPLRVQKARGGRLHS